MFHSQRLGIAGVVCGVALAALLTQSASACDDGACEAGGWCEFGEALDLTGIRLNREYVEAGHRNVPLERSMTIEAWVWHENPQDREWSTILSRTQAFWQWDTEMPNPYSDFNFQVDDYGLLSFFMGNGIIEPFQYGMLLLSPEPLPSKRWTHVAVTVWTEADDNACSQGPVYTTQNPMGTSRLCTDPIEGRLYIDGEQVDVDIWLDGHRNFVDYQQNPLHMGFYDNTDYDKQWWNGYIDELRVWDHVRTVEQLQDNMFRALPRTGTLQDGLLMYYQFDNMPKTPQNASVIVDSSAGGYDGLVQFDGPPGPVYYVENTVCMDTYLQHKAENARSFYDAHVVAQTL